MTEYSKSPEESPERQLFDLFKDSPEVEDFLVIGIYRKGPLGFPFHMAYGKTEGLLQQLEKMDELVEVLRQKLLESFNEGLQNEGAST